MGVEYNLDTADPIREETTQLKPPIQIPSETEEFEDQIIVPAGADFLLCYASAEGRFFAFYWPGLKCELNNL